MGALDYAALLKNSGCSSIAARTRERLDGIAYAVAAVIDAKTPYAARHSTNVAHDPVCIALSMRADADRCRATLRAGLLHDIGQRGISNRIPDKPPTLTDEESGEIRQHPRWTWEILGRVRALNGFAHEAVHYNGRRDGKGYWWKLWSLQVGQHSRVLAVADVYEVLTADRPYRAGLSVTVALDIMRRDRGRAFDRQVLDAAAVAERGTFSVLSEGRDDLFPQLRQERAQFIRCDGVG